MFRPGIWAYLARRAELTYLRECDRRPRFAEDGRGRTSEARRGDDGVWIRVLPENLDGAETLAIP